MKSWILVLLGIVALLGAATNQVRAEDDFQYWSRLYLKIHNGEKVDFNFYSEGWFRNDAERLELFLLSPRVTYALHKNLNLAANYTYLRFRGATVHNFKYQHRAEGEINPYWKFSNGMKLSMRNRMEFRWIEGKGSNNTRMRNRVRLTVPTKGLGPLASVFADSEFFYTFRTDRHDQQRSTPFGINCNVSDQLDLQVSWMIQNLKGSEDWKSNQILATMLTYAF